MMCKHLFYSTVTPEERAMAKAGKTAAAAIALAVSGGSQAPQVLTDQFLRRHGVKKTPTELLHGAQPFQPKLPNLKDVNVDVLQSLLHDVAPNIFGKGFKFFLADPIYELLDSDRALKYPDEVLDFLALNELFLKDEYSEKEFEMILTLKEVLVQAFNTAFYAAEAEVQGVAAGKIHLQLQTVKNRQGYVSQLAKRMDQLDVLTVFLFFDWLEIRKNIVEKQRQNYQVSRAVVISNIDRLITKYIYETGELSEASQKILLNRFGKDGTLLMQLTMARFILIPAINDFYKMQLAVLKKNDPDDMEKADQIISHWMQFPEQIPMAKKYLTRLLADPTLERNYHSRFSNHLSNLD